MYPVVSVRFKVEVMGSVVPFVVNEWSYPYNVGMYVQETKDDVRLFSIIL